jgi:predicted amidohydrolase
MHGNPTDSVRVAATSGLLKGFATFEAFAENISTHVRHAKDLGADLITFPEFVTAGLGIIRKDWTKWRGEMITLATDLAARHDIWICAGSMLHLEDGKWRNTASLVTPSGEIFHQRKMHPTPFERNTWKMKPYHEICLIDSPFGKIAMAVCYDIEFPEAVRAAAEAGAEIVLNPSWTEDEPGYWRIRTCAAARCIENTLFVVQSSLVGGMPEIPGFEHGIGRASVLTPSDEDFPLKGIAIESDWRVEQTAVTEINLDTLRKARTSGKVTPMADRHHGAYKIHHV